MARWYLIFQPAEEGGGGAREMIKDGLFEKFPDGRGVRLAQLAWHAGGHFAVSAGPVMASSNEFKITIRGKGCHAALPHNGIDPVPDCLRRWCRPFKPSSSRNKKPIDAGVISVTMIHAGEATNVVPDSCELQGTVRTFSVEMLDLIERRMRTRSPSTSAPPIEATCEFDFARNYPPTINHRRRGRFRPQCAG
jgi:hippurate hydrolase